MSNPLQADFQDYKGGYARKDKLLIRTEAFLKKHIIKYLTEIKTLCLYNEGCYQELSEEAMKSLIIKEFPGFPNSVRNRVFENIKILSHCSVNDFNQSNIFNFKNGVFDVEKNQMFPHSPDILSTIQIDYNYDPEATCPRWEKFMTECHRNTINIQNIQEFAGYCLTRDTSMEKALFIIGKGANGKGVFTETLVSTLGNDNFSTATLEALADESRRSMIVNKLVNLDTEVSKRAECFESAFKAIVSGEAVSINEKYAKRFSYSPYCKLIFSTNEMPRIDDASFGFYRRMLIIPFNQSFIGREDRKLKKYLAENERAGIFNWCLEGLNRLRDQGGFTMNSAIELSLSEIREENNPVNAFIADHIVNEHKAYITKDDMYIAYREWCNNNGHKPFSKNRFGRELMNSADGIETETIRVNSKSKRVWLNIRLRTDLDDRFDSTIKEETISWDQ